MAVVKNKSTEENREFWSHVEAVVEDVKTWPRWTEDTGPKRTREESAVKCADQSSCDGARRQHP